VRPPSTLSNSEMSPGPPPEGGAETRGTVGKGILYIRPNVFRSLWRHLTALNLVVYHRMYAGDFMGLKIGIGWR